MTHSVDCFSLFIDVNRSHLIASIVSHKYLELNSLNAPAFTLLQVETTTLGIPEPNIQWAKGRLVVLVFPNHVNV